MKDKDTDDTERVISAKYNLFSLFYKIVDIKYQGKNEKKMRVRVRKIE
jgi:hypothetical protein